MAPSKKVPVPPLLPSPPVPRMMAPCKLLGLYPGDGRAPSHMVTRVPDCASAAFNVNWFPEGPLSMAVAKLAITDWLLGVVIPWDCQPPLSPLNIPFSRSAAIHGPLPSPWPPHVMSVPQ